MGLATRLSRAGVPVALWLALPNSVAPQARGGGGAAPSEPLPATALAVRERGEWRTWWLAEQAPASWGAADARVAGAVSWESLRPGLEQGLLELGGQGAAWRFHLVLVRLDPAAFEARLRLATRDYGLKGAWTVDSISADAVMALNAGQFDGGTPWGWLVQGGAERRPPSDAPLASAVVVGRGGSFRILEPSAVESARRSGDVLEAFQSYPTILAGNGEVPEPLRASGRGVDVAHRDSRLALCTLRDGRLLVALTRLGAPGGTAALLPFGPTTPETAAIMGALGCQHAVMLDGGLSSQLLLRTGDGDVRRWPGLRRVPLALELFVRNGSS